MLYIELRLYVSNRSKLKINIIKYIYEFLLEDYIERLFIYNRVSSYYY